MLEFGKMKTTVTISKLTQYRLKKLKEDWSYDEYINYLIRKRYNISNIDEFIKEKVHNKITVCEKCRSKMHSTTADCESYRGV